MAFGGENQPREISWVVLWHNQNPPITPSLLALDNGRSQNLLRFWRNFCLRLGLGTRSRVGNWFDRFINGGKRHEGWRDDFWSWTIWRSDRGWIRFTYGTMTKVVSKIFNSNQLWDSGNFTPKHSIYMLHTVLFTFLWYWQGEFVGQSGASKIGDHFLCSFDFKIDTARRVKSQDLLLRVKGLRVN